MRSVSKFLAITATLTGALVLSQTSACSSGGAVVRHDLPPTGGQVRFAPTRKAFYDTQWVKRAKATQPRICAGFVHKERFERYLKFGKFHLEMTMQVYKGGEPDAAAQDATAWKDGELLRTIKRRIPVTARTNSYVWCGRLQKEGLWKVGAMRFQFVLRGPERAMDEQLATGLIRITE